MVPGHADDSNIVSTLSADSSFESQYTLVGDTGEALPKKTEPPQVLISLEHVSQMRERRRQLMELQQWAERHSEETAPNGAVDSSRRNTPK